MLGQEQIKMLKSFYNALADRPLTPDDAYYVPIFEENPELDDPIANLATRISWSESQSVSLLTGMRGSGKSTELRRLKQKLEDDGCTVFLTDMRDYMSMTSEIEVTDLLISLMLALSEAVHAEFGDSPMEEAYGTRLLRWLQSDVKIEELNLKAGIADIKASLQQDATFKQKLQTALRGHVARVVRDAHDYASEVVAFVRNQSQDPDRKVVFLVDSLERIRAVNADEADRIYYSVENTFSGHADSLQLPMLHLVYTIPPYLIPLAPGLGNNLGGGTVCSLPSIHVRDREGSDDAQGIAAMQSILARRCEQWKDVFSNEQVKEIAAKTGGDLRDFFRFVGDTLVKSSTHYGGGLPVPDTILEKTQNQLKREMLPIAKEDVEWLRRIATSKKSELDSIDELSRLARFFDTRLVLNYRNGEDWYDVHPLIRSELDGGEGDNG